MTRAAFTLTEVLLSTLILVVAGLTILMLIPNAIKAQQDSRYQMLSAIHAQNTIEAFYQHEIDLKRTTLDFDGTSPRDLGVPDYSFFMKRQMLGPLGEYDLERLCGNRMSGNYPVPLEIARRLDSPNDEIRKILDSGGYIYYNDPSRAGRMNAKVRGDNDAGNKRGDMQRLVWGVVGHAQQNLLAYHPAGIPVQEVYPFPPQSRNGMVPRVFKYRTEGDYTYVKHDSVLYRKGDLYNGVYLDQDTWIARWELDPTDQKIDLYAYNHMIKGESGDHGSEKGFGLKHNEQSFYETHNWEWYAAKPDLADSGQQNLWSRSVPLYRQLVNKHWLRILHQLDYIHVSNNDKPDMDVGEIPTFYWRDEVVLNGDGSIQRTTGGNAVVRRIKVQGSNEMSRVNGGQTPGAHGSSPVYIEVAGDSGFSETFYPAWRGYPAPAIGLPTSRLKGSDIFEEDAYAVRDNLITRLRISMPSLERRIMYRSAALALWAAAAYGLDITDPDDHTKIFVEQEDRPGFLADGRSIGTASGTSPYPGLTRDALRINQNPLYGYENLSGFTGANGQIITNDLHPTQVLALSHVAHAAMMVNGYKPPFYKNNNTLHAGDDDLLVPDESHVDYLVDYDELPYKAVDFTPMIDESGTVVTTSVQVPLADGTLRAVSITANGELDLDGAGLTIAELHQSLRDENGELWEAYDDDLADPDSRYVFGTLATSGGDPGAPVVVNVTRNCYLWNPENQVCQDSADNDADGVSGDEDYSQMHDLQTPITTPLAPGTFLNNRFQLWENGMPIMFRPMVGSVINKFNPPYADRGAFTAGGHRNYGDEWILGATWESNNTGTRDVLTGYHLVRRIPTVYDKDMNGDSTVNSTDRVYRAAIGGSGGYRNNSTANLNALYGKDTEWAHNAHEACLRLAMYYTADNPYDMTVPKPANRSIMTDRGLYQYDLFDASGNAQRPYELTQKDVRDFDRYYTVTFPATNARFGAQWADIGLVDSPVEYGAMAHKKPFLGGVDNSHNEDGASSNDVSLSFTDKGWLMQEPFAPYVSGRGFDYGAPPDPSWSRQSKGGEYEAQRANPYVGPENFTRFLNLMHGYDPAEPNTTLKVSQAAPKRPSRFHGVEAFEAQDRSRQLVYWLVDWMNYEDFEKVPSCPVDYSQLDRFKHSPIVWTNDTDEKTSPLRLKLEFHDWFNYYDMGDTVKLYVPSLQGTPHEIVSGPVIEWSYDGGTPEKFEPHIQLTQEQIDAVENKPAYILMTDIPGASTGLDAQQAGNDIRFLRGNPEYDFTWVDPERTATRWVFKKENTSKIDADYLSGRGFGYYASGHTACPVSTLSFGQGEVHIIDEGGLSHAPLRDLGAFGADRDGNGELTAGHIPASTRMTAREINRFIFYDPITWISLRR